MTLTKRYIADQIAKTSGLPVCDVLPMVKKVFGIIRDALARGDRVELRDFGVFLVCVRKGRVGRNPRKPEQTVKIPDRKTVKFKPGRLMKELVLKS